MGQNLKLSDLPKYHGAVDLEKAHWLARSRSGGDEEADAYLAWLLERTKLIVDLPWNWAAVKALAEALLDRQELTGRTARKIYAQAVGEAMKSPR